MEGNSLKNIDELSGCISRQWAGNGTPITSLPIENGVSLLVPQAMGDMMLCLISKKQEMAVVLLFMNVYQH